MSAVSLIVFSGEYDRAMAALTIANGAAGEGGRVSVFFTFWGLNLLRRRRLPGGNMLQKAFKRLMPAGADQLPISHCNFLGAGPRLLRRLIRSQDGQTLRDLLDMAVERGVDLVACEASLKMLGLTRRELLATDALRIGDIHDFLAAAREAEICLFI